MKKLKFKLYDNFLSLSQGYRATMRRQITFYRWVHRSPRYSLDHTLNIEKLSRPLSHPVVLSSVLLDWKSNFLTAKPLPLTWSLCPIDIKTINFNALSTTEITLESSSVGKTKLKQCWSIVMDEKLQYILKKTLIIYSNGESFQKLVKTLRPGKT